MGEQEKHGLAKTNEDAWSAEAVYSHIAHALARGYTDLYYVNIDSDEFIEFHTDDTRGVLSEARRGTDFFEGCERDAKLFIHPDDQAAFVQAMNREFLEEALAGNKVFELSYRRIKDGDPFYVLMKISRMEEDSRFVVLAVSDIDELVRKRRAEERIREERVVYARLHAITGNFIVIYVVDPENGDYREFSATADFEEHFEQAKTGTDFFGTVRGVASAFNHPDDLDLFLSEFTRENVLAEVASNGIFTLGYRLLMENGSTYVQMKAAMVEEKEGPRLIVGLNDIDAQVRQEQAMVKRLALAESQANIDALTGVKNKHSYLEAEARIDRQIANRRQQPFAIAILDVNDLKAINDTSGHQAGDTCLRDACKVICDIFKHSPVFRVGGDEFAVIAQGIDYDNIGERIDQMAAYNAEALKSGSVCIACGVAKYDNDSSAAPVFERADHAMYEDKNRLKTVHA